MPTKVALHRTPVRGTAVWSVYVGPNPLGPNGGCCGNVVDAKEVWRTSGYRCPDWILIGYRRLCLMADDGAPEAAIILAAKAIYRARWARKDQYLAIWRAATQAEVDYHEAHGGSA